MNDLEELKRLAYENACCRCQYHKNGKCKNEGECVWASIEKKLRAFEIIKSHAKENKHFRFLLYMAKYWEENEVEITKELLYNYDFPYTKDEFDLLKEVMK